MFIDGSKNEDIFNLEDLPENYFRPEVFDDKKMFGLCADKDNNLSLYSFDYKTKKIIEAKYPKNQRSIGSNKLFINDGYLSYQYYDELVETNSLTPSYYIDIYEANTVGR